MEFGKKKELWINIVSAVFFIFSLFCCMYYIWSDFFVLETNTDVLDNLMWAQASVESGKLINLDYTYPYFIPLGGHLLMVPFVKIFGLGIFSARLGMTIFSVVMTIVMVLFFRTFLTKWYLSLVCTGCMLLSMLSTEKIREMFFGHVLHYSLAILLWMLSIILIDYFDKYKKKDEKKTKMIIGLLTIHFWVVGIEGMTVTLFAGIPWIGFIILKFLFSEKTISKYSKWDKKAIICSCIGLILGIVTYKKISYGIVTTYEQGFMEYDLYKNWVKNIELFFSQWVYLWLDIFSYNDVYVEILSLNGIVYLVKNAMMLMTLLFAISTFFVYHKFEKEIEKKIIISYWVLSLATIYFYVFGKIGVHSWRMLPFWFGTIIVSIMVVKVLVLNKYFVKLKRVAIVVILIMLCNSGLNGLLVLNRNIDTNSTWFGEGTMIDILKENNLTEGYVIDYWMGNSITVLTNEEIRVRCVGLSAEADVRSNEKLNSSFI
ncbi:MAG: hypothetical protein E7285_02125 [Lachnospiraceae bacterium]|nr:hypothetical protein [Lachnospiraceae bacterium]